MFKRNGDNPVTDLVIGRDDDTIRYFQVSAGNFTTKYRKWLEELVTDFDNRIEIHSRKPVPDIMKEENGELVFSVHVMGYRSVTQLYDCNSRELVLRPAEKLDTLFTRAQMVWPVTLADVQVLLDHGNYLADANAESLRAPYASTLEYDVCGAWNNDYRDPSYTYQDDLSAICHEHLPPLSVHIKSVIWDSDDHQELVFDYLKCGSCNYPTRCKRGIVGTIQTRYLCAEMFLGIYGYCIDDDAIKFNDEREDVDVVIDTPIISVLEGVYGPNTRAVLPKGVTWKNTFCVIISSNGYENTSLPDDVYQVCLMIERSDYRYQVLFKNPDTGIFVKPGELENDHWHSFPAIYLDNVRDHFGGDDTIHNVVLCCLPDDYRGDLFVRKYDWDTRNVNGLGRFENHQVVNESDSQYHLRYTRAKSARK